MRVDGTGNGNNLALIERLQDPGKYRGLLPTVSTGYREAPVPEVATNTSPSLAVTPNVAPDTPEAPSAVSPPADESPRGVIRLLQEGHFRGVADVRLRINFAEELQGIQAASTGALLNEGVPALQDELNAAIDAFVDVSDLPEEAATDLRSAQTGFNIEVGALLEGGGLSTDVFAGLRTAFQDFLAALVPPQPPEDESILPIAPAADEVAPETGESILAATPAETVAAGGETGIVNDIFAGLRESLSGIFEEALAGLQESISELALPPLSEPNGNGRAYERFLAAYNDIFGAGGGTDTGTPQTGLDTVS